MVNSDDFAKRLQEIMDFYGLSSSALADEIDFNRSSISHLLSGRNKPSLEFVMKILEKFPEVKLYWLLNGKGSFPDSEPENEFPKKVESIPTLVAENKISKNESKEFSNLKDLNNQEFIERIIIFYKNGSFKEYKN
ncbi:MAG: helix-turn-helix domain-containing protein [Flavobacteriaceae bacterium]|nr:helix-turn-helix domain-containing protein [Flavobacteriaceae bacterium]